MTHKRSWLALGALLAAIVGGTVWAAEQEKSVPPTSRLDLTGADRCAAKERSCCEDKCCTKDEAKSCCEGKCCTNEKSKGCCADGKCCGCCAKAKDKQAVTLPVPPGSTFHVLVAPPLPGMAFDMPFAPPPPPCVAMPCPREPAVGAAWSVMTAPQPVPPMQYTPVTQYAATSTFGNTSGTCPSMQYTPVTQYAATPCVPPPAPCSAERPQCNPWKVRAVVEKDRTTLEMQVNAGGEETRACCDSMVLKIGKESLEVAIVDKQVQVHGSFVKGSADTVTRNSADGSILLEGHVKLKYEKAGQKAEVSAERVVVGVADGRLEVKPVDRPQVFTFWIGGGFR